jgi:hypothetical protein
VSTFGLACGVSKKGGMFCSFAGRAKIFLSAASSTTECCPSVTPSMTTSDGAFSRLLCSSKRPGSFCSPKPRPPSTAERRGPAPPTASPAAPTPGGGGALASLDRRDGRLVVGEGAVVDGGALVDGLARGRPPRRGAAQQRVERGVRRRHVFLPAKGILRRPEPRRFALPGAGRSPELARPEAGRSPERRGTGPRAATRVRQASKIGQNLRLGLPWGRVPWVIVNPKVNEGGGYPGGLVTQRLTKGEGTLGDC